MGKMKDLHYRAQEICNNCALSSSKCGKCKINVFMKDAEGNSIQVVLKGSNKEILKVIRLEVAGASA